MGIPFFSVAHREETMYEKKGQSAMTSDIWGMGGHFLSILFGFSFVNCVERSSRYLGRRGRRGN